ncbi:MAG: hypothetical protein ABIR81_09085 [Ginsengibacter sp.]
MEIKSEIYKNNYFIFNDKSIAMSTKYLLGFLLIAGITSCSTSYRTTQTPDDVYYSPVAKGGVYVNTRTDNDRVIYDNSVGYDRPSTYPDVYVRRSRRERRYDNYQYNNYPYGYNYPYGIYPYGTYPNGTSPVYIDPKTGKAPKYYKPRKFNLDSYRNPASVPPNTTVDPKTGKVRILIPQSPPGTVQQPYTPNNRTRRIYMPSTTSGSRNIDNSSSRTYEPSRSNTNSNNNSSSSNSRSSSTPSPAPAATTAPVRSFEKK